MDGERFPRSLNVLDRKIEVEITPVRKVTVAVAQRRVGRGERSRGEAMSHPVERSSDEDVNGIFVLAQQFASSRHVHSTAGRRACLLRAAEAVLQNTQASDAFVMKNQDEFLLLFDDRQPNEVECHQCGARMQEAGGHDEELGEWMPLWLCARCGAQVPR